ncbi:MAG: hypothetical protein OXI41_01880 [Chloroflexota bacterium]|nr:hypothetical protein [Chloroflexota bacterium]MDE2895570.1 hypothetical protein [Chloroflexota bacterium]
MAQQTCKWTGFSGTEYEYYIYEIGQTFDAVPGNYIFARETSPNRFSPIYIGQTGDLSERFDSHHKMPCIRRAGATHIHAHKNSGGQAARLAEERDLIRAWNTPCND